MSNKYLVIIQVYEKKNAIPGIILILWFLNKTNNYQFPVL